MTYCGERSIDTIEQGTRLAVSLRCRSWCCEDCKHDRQRQLVAKALAGQPTRLLTLTSRRTAGTTREAAAKALVRAWRLIRRKIRSQSPREKVEFLAIFEETKLGWPHLHVLVRSGWIDQHWISSQMARLTNSPVVDIRFLRSRKGAARYVAKYTAKGPGKFGTLKRYWTSATWEVEKWIKPQSSSAWEVQRMSLRTWCDAWRSFGWNVELLSDFKAIARAPP